MVGKIIARKKYIPRLEKISRSLGSKLDACNNKLEKNKNVNKDLHKINNEAIQMHNSLTELSSRYREQVRYSLTIAFDLAILINEKKPDSKTKTFRCLVMDSGKISDNLANAFKFLNNLFRCIDKICQMQGLGNSSQQQSIDAIKNNLKQCFRNIFIHLNKSSQDLLLELLENSKMERAKKELGSHLKNNGTTIDLRKAKPK